MRILTIITGVLLVLTGLWCVANQGAAFTALAFVLGIVMIIKGLISALAFFRRKEQPEGLEWNLAEAMVSIILGIVVLSNQLATDLMIIMFFGMWLLFAGCNGIAFSLALKNREDKMWNWTLILGIVSVAVGIYAFLNPIIAGLAAGLVVGIIFLVQGVNTLVFGITMPKSKKNKSIQRYMRSTQKIEGK